MNRANRKNNRKFPRTKHNNRNTNNNTPIRTVYVAPVNPAIVDQISDYFKQFGEVEIVTLKQLKNNFQCGFVQFDTASAAEMAISNSPHKISNYEVKVKPADLWHQPDFQSGPKKDLLDPPGRKSPSHILNALKDNCLREVFSYLPLPDLSSVADVCLRFNQLAKEVFPSKYRNKSVSINSEFRDRIEDSRAMLRNFGPLIRSLSIGFNMEVFGHSGHSLRIYNQHCSALMKELDITHYHFRGDWKKLRPMFAGLQKLTLNNCGLSKNYKHLLVSCTELKTLCLNYSFWFDLCISQSFPKLEEASFTSNWSSDSAFIKFVSLNPRLVKLKFVDNRLKSTGIFGAIAQHTRTLQELEVNEKIQHVTKFQEDLLNLSRLHSLKVLKLHFNSASVTPLMVALANNSIPIEHLKLCQGDINAEAINSISQMKRIRIFEVNEVEGFNDEQLIDLAKELPELQELHLVQVSGLSTIGLKKMLPFATKLKVLELKLVPDVRIDIDDYGMMLETIQSREEKGRLLIEVEAKGKIVDIPKTVLLENIDWIQITEKIFFECFPDSDTELSGEISDFYDFDDDIMDDMDSDDFDEHLFLFSG